MKYSEFLKTKELTVISSGFDAVAINPKLFTGYSTKCVV